MRHHLIVGRLGTGDKVPVPTRAGEVATTLDLVAGQRALDHGIGRAIADLAGLGIRPSEIGVDVLVLAAHVHAADTRISRGSESQDGWTREIRLSVPVSDLLRWNSAASTLGKMLDFLTGDRWEINFRARPANFSTIIPADGDQLIDPPYDDVSLFSGGLDSLIGAIDALDKGRTPLLISHAGEAAVSKSQADVFDALKAHYRRNSFERLRLWMDFPRDLVRGSTGEDTTRGRSFLFFAAGVFAGSGLQRAFRLEVPENGLIAVNVPLDKLRLGALSTRTTHPFYIARWNDLLAILDIPGRIENPYWNKTKGEMVRSCRNRSLLESVAMHSLSCASPSKARWRGFASQHCGYCLPCLIRRAALVSGLSPNPDPTTYTIADLRTRALNTRAAEGVQVRSFQLAAARLRERPDLATALIHKPGPLFDESPARQAALADVYRRGLAEVDTLLAGVRTSPQ